MLNEIELNNQDNELFKKFKELDGLNLSKLFITELLDKDKFDWEEYIWGKSEVLNDFMKNIILDIYSSIDDIKTRGFENKSSRRKAKCDLIKVKKYIKEKMNKFNSFLEEETFRLFEVETLLIKLSEIENLIKSSTFLIKGVKTKAFLYKNYTVNIYDLLDTIHYLKLKIIRVRNYLFYTSEYKVFKESFEVVLKKIDLDEVIEKLIMNEKKLFINKEDLNKLTLILINNLDELKRCERLSIILRDVIMKRFCSFEMSKIRELLEISEGKKVLVKMQ